jgi:hypothetical protein
MKLSKKNKKTKKIKKKQYIGGAKSSYDDYDYLDGTYKLLLEQYRSKPSGFQDNNFLDEHLYLYGYDDFVGANKLIPIKEYVGFRGIKNFNRTILEGPPINMPIYYYMSELVFRNNIVTEYYYGYTRTPNGSPDNGLLEMGVRGYIKEEDTIKIQRTVGIPPYGNPKAWSPNRWKDITRTGKPTPDDGSVSDAYIDKFLFIPRGRATKNSTGYKFVVIKPSSVSNIYHTEVGEIELNGPGGGEHWFDSEQVCIVFDEFFIPLPLESQEQTFNTRGVAAEMLNQSRKK